MPGLPMPINGYISIDANPGIANAGTTNAGNANAGIANAGIANANNDKQKNSC